MHRVINFKTSKESTGDMIKAGRFNTCLKITFRNRFGRHTHKLSAGTDDVLDVYREGKETFVLSTNSRLDYSGLEIFEGSEKKGHIFIQGHQVKDVLGSDDLAPFNTIKRLMEHIM